MDDPKHYTGLTKDEVAASRQQFGSNAIELKEDKVLLHVLKGILLEPMFILLCIACTVYFVVGQFQEGVIMVVAIMMVSGISFYQDYRSRKAIQALRKLSAPRANVLRNRQRLSIATEEIVKHDIVLLQEGEIVPADGLILEANDLSINESLLTGESLPVIKNADNNFNVYKGSLVVSGSAIIQVTETGANTMFGKIGLSLQEITVIKTPLQQQVASFVKYMVWFGSIAFLLVFAYNYYESKNFVHALLHGLTLAMSVIPEEIPVAFSTFMALGAFRLLRNNIIVKQPQYVETLGAATVICVDKTGTLTKNKMSIAYLYDAVGKISVDAAAVKELPAILIEYAMWASETKPFDPMEKAIHELYESTCGIQRRDEFKQVHEYPVGGRPPMMTHIFKNEMGETIIAAKGAPEAILQQSHLPVDFLKGIEKQALAYARQGYRVLGVGKAKWEAKKWPLSQQEFEFEFLGMVAFYDPPKENIAATIKILNEAGIAVKMITGDYAETAIAIATQVQLPHNHQVITGKEVLQLDEKGLRQKVKQVNIFARMFPEAKLKVIEALRDNGEIVAMTGDGVNDAPALKAAHIGIAMGIRGSEVAKSTASLILTDDDLGHMTEAVALGRKIYDNLKKAIQYIVSIHIPILLIVTMPLLLFWKYTDIFSPIHIIFLELIMGPTCSIMFENEPMEAGTMQRAPRKQESTFLSGRQLGISIVQGLVIAAGCLGIGFYYIHQLADEITVRTVIFITLLFSNIFLTLANRSFYYSVFTTIKYKNNLVWLISGISVLFIAGFLCEPHIQHLFRLNNTTPSDVLICFAVALLSTFWIEAWKYFKRK